MILHMEYGNFIVRMPLKAKHNVVWWNLNILNIIREKGKIMCLQVNAIDNYIQG